MVSKTVVKEIKKKVQKFNLVPFSSILFLSPEPCALCPELCALSPVLLTRCNIQD